MRKAYWPSLRDGMRPVLGALGFMPQTGRMELELELELELVRVMSLATAVTPAPLSYNNISGLAKVFSTAQAHTCQLLATPDMDNPRRPI